MNTYIPPQCECMFFAAEDNFLASTLKGQSIEKANAHTYDEYNDFWE